jgi:hypothetical protein
METLEYIARYMGLAASFAVGMNVGTYRDTKNWLLSHTGMDPAWEREQAERDKDTSAAAYIRYHLGNPGRELARQLYAR